MALITGICRTVGELQLLLKDLPADTPVNSLRENTEPYFLVFKNGYDKQEVCIGMEVKE
jgi:hypothetical protein